jgi:two-component system, NtrC family, sensor kinase
MDGDIDRNELKQLQKENRILKKQLERANGDRVKLEETTRKKEALLKTVIFEVQASQSTLKRKSIDLEQAIDELKTMQDKLVESEKMSALGTLVAGVAHEINTPVGTSITLASTLADETTLLMATLVQGQLKRSEFQAYLEIAAESTSLLLANLNRAGELVQSFKQVAVDQASLDRRTFRIKPYLEEVAISLSPHVRKTHHTLIVTGDELLEIDSCPGVIAQIATNLVTNSLNYAFKPEELGRLHFEVTREGDHLLMTYRDNGCGIPAESLSKIFNPFFTTGRHQGGTGLGLHIVYNLVTQTLRGQIDVRSAIDEGTYFQILLPLSISS